MGALSAHRQVFAMAQAAVRAHVDMALDICRDIAPEITFDFETLIEYLADLDNIVIGKVVTLRSREIPACSRIFREPGRPMP